MFAFVCVCSRLLAFSPLHLLAFVCVCLRLLALTYPPPPFAAPPLCVTLTKNNLKRCLGLTFGITIAYKLCDSGALNLGPLSGTGDSQRDSHESIRANHSLIDTPYISGQFQVQVCLVTERAIFVTDAFEACFKGIWASDFPYVLRMDKP